MTRSVQTALVAILLVLPLAAAAQDEAMHAPPEDAMMDSMIGHWTGSGNMFGMEATEATHYEWTLGHQFVHSTHEIMFTTEQGEMPFSGQFFVQPNGDGTYASLWMDSMGTNVTFTTTVVDGDMIGEWTDESGTHRSVGSMSDAGVMSVVYMMMGEDGSWAETGTMVFNRTE